MEPLNDVDRFEIEAALAETEKGLMNLKGKHIKSVLSRLERINAVTPQVRKIILDEFNDLTRENLRLLGYETED